MAGSIVLVHLYGAQWSTMVKGGMRMGMGTRSRAKEEEKKKQPKNEDGKS